MSSLTDLWRQAQAQHLTSEKDTRPYWETQQRGTLDEQQSYRDALAQFLLSEKDRSNHKSPAPEYNSARPELYDRYNPEDDVMAMLKAFGAGVVDPYGATSWGLGKLGFDNAAAHLQESRGNSPRLANLGSDIGISAIPGAAMFPKAVGYYGRFKSTPASDVLLKSLEQSAKVSSAAAMPLMAGTSRGTGLGDLIDGLNVGNMRYPSRAQGAYPKDGY